MVVDYITDSEIFSKTYSSFMVWCRPDPLPIIQTSLEDSSQYKSETIVKSGPLIVNLL